MLIQLNRNDDHRTFTATAIDLPVNPAHMPVRNRGAQPVVAVFGHPGRVAGLPQHLPTGWSMRRPPDVDDVRPGELVLFANATVEQVGTARSVLPSRTRIVALVDEDSPAEAVAGVLTAGADVCVRGGQPAILASHLVACRRRQLAERWVNLDAQAAL
ncbi:hypothetical protein ACWKSP_39360 [Micromonosporaceae bacterium Da 78-11]